MEKRSSVVHREQKLSVAVLMIMSVLIWFSSVMGWLYINGDLQRHRENPFGVEVAMERIGFLNEEVQRTIPLIAEVVLLVANGMWLLAVLTIIGSNRKAKLAVNEAVADYTKFKQAVDGVSDHVIMTDPDGVITYANKAAERMTGYSKEEMYGERPSLWGKQMPAEFYKNFWKVIKTDKQSFTGEIVNKRKNGQLYDAESLVSPILDSSGNVLFFVGIERDISKAKAVDRMKTEFISLASHQLRTPLSAVRWFGEMLANGDAGKLTKTQM